MVAALNYFFVIKVENRLPKAIVAVRSFSNIIVGLPSFVRREKIRNTLMIIEIAFWH